MKLHKEGNTTITIASSISIVLSTLVMFTHLQLWLRLLLILPILFLFVFILRFFRIPDRQFKEIPNAVLSCADGTVVAIEEVEENEFFHEKRLLVSVFMSVNNVHINWFPISGTVVYQKYHPGKFLVAWHPKSSTDNERTTVVIRNNHGEVMFRQIAGALARRIVCNATKDQIVTQCSEVGFIKFGSRVDHYLPLNAELKVSLNDKVTGGKTCLATFKA